MEKALKIGQATGVVCAVVCFAALIGASVMMIAGLDGNAGKLAEWAVLFMGLALPGYVCSLALLTRR